MQPEIVAHHFTEARLLEKAITYWHSAGQQAVAKSAVREAVGHLRKGLALIADLPRSSERGRRELDLQVTLGGALQAAKGYSHPEVFEAFGRARELIAETGGAGTPHGFSVLWGLCIANYVGADSYAALEQASEYLSIAQSQTETGPLIIGHRLLGTSLMINGNYPEALSHLERAVSLCTPEEHQTLAFQFGQDNRSAHFSAGILPSWNNGPAKQAIIE